MSTGGTKKVTLEFTIKGADLINKLVKIAGAQDKIAKATKRAGKSAKDQKGAIDGAGASMLRFGKQALTAIGLMSIPATTMAAWKTFDDRLKRIADKQVEVGAAAVSFAALQPKDKVASREAEVLAIGAELGIGATETLLTATLAQSTAKDFEKGLPILRETLRLTKLIGDAEASRASIKVAPVLGLLSKELNSLIIGAFENAAATEVDAVRAAAALPEFSAQGKVDPVFGVSVLSALTTGGIDKATLRQAASSTANFLTNIGGALVQDIDKQRKGRGLGTFQELGLNERLKATREFVLETQGAVDVEALQIAGLTEKRQRQAVAALLKEENFGTLQGLIADAPTFAARFATERRVQDIRESPTVRAKFQTDQTRAIVEAVHLLTPVADRAAQGRRARQAIGAEAGFGVGTDTVTGEALWWRRLGEVLSGPANVSFGPGVVGIRAGQERTPAADRLQDALESQLVVLHEIVDVLKTDTSTPSPLTGGNASE